MTDGRTAVVGKRIPRRFQGGVSPGRAGMVAVILIVIATFLAFSKQLPWRQPFEFKAVFQSAANIRLDSPVRIAGVEVGKVVKVEHVGGSKLTVVTMEVYRALYSADPEFRELFKVKADFDQHITRTPEHEQAFAGLIAAITQRENLLPLNPEAVARVVEEGMRCERSPESHDRVPRR